MLLNLLLLFRNLFLALCISHLLLTLHIIFLLLLLQPRCSIALILSILVLPALYRLLVILLSLVGFSHFLCVLLIDFLLIAFLWTTRV